MINAEERLASIAWHPFLELTHYGRKSNRPYHVTLWFAAEGDSVYVVTGRSGRGWARNLRANLRAHVAIGGQHFKGRATPVTGNAERRRARALIEAKYWLARPLFCVSRLVVRLGLIADWGTRDGVFRIRLA